MLWLRHAMAFHQSCFLHSTHANTFLLPDHLSHTRPTVSQGHHARKSQRRRTQHPPLPRLETSAHRSTPRPTLARCSRGLLRAARNGDAKAAIVGAVQRARRRCRRRSALYRHADGRRADCCRGALQLATLRHGPRKTVPLDFTRGRRGHDIG